MARRSDASRGGPPSRGIGFSPVNSKKNKATKPNSRFITASQVALLFSTATARGTDTLPSFNPGRSPGVRVESIYLLIYFPPASASQRKLNRLAATWAKGGQVRRVACPRAAPIASSLHPSAGKRSSGSEKGEVRVRGRAFLGKADWCTSKVVS